MLEQATQIAFPVGYKVRLRPLTVEDAPACMSWMNNPLVTKFLKRQQLISLAEERAWIEGLAGRQDSITLGMETLGDEPKLIGSIGLHHINFQHGTAGTGTVIGLPEFWGKGYGTDAKMLLLHNAFVQMGLRKVRSSVYDFNAGSLAYARTCGYEEEGRLIQDLWKNGRLVDKVLLAVFRDQWLPLWDRYCATGSTKLAS